MNRGKSYHWVPTASKRTRKTRVWLVLLVAVLLFCVGELIAYGIHNQNNRAAQAALTARYRADLLLEQQATKPDQTPLEAMPAVTPQARHSVAAINRTPITTPLNHVFFQTVGLTRSLFTPLLKRNPDTVGWLTIQDIVDMPVVYRDNEYYLTHDFDGEKNTCGAIFLDVNHPLNANSQNLLIYGHNMKDSSMFGRLTHYYTDSNYLRTHYTVKLETRLESFTYLIFAVLRVDMDINSTGFLNFADHPTFSNAMSFRDYIDKVYQHSVYSHFLDLDENDTLLTMATCIGDDRLVLVARRQRVDETDADIQRNLLGLYTR